MKVGQYPAWDISIDKSISSVLGKYKELFKKGLICESQGYGIGAYAYYRRIVELSIDELLDDICELVDESGRDKYKIALRKTKETSVASEKIELVKDLLPASLRPAGMNPLGLLYGFLREGIHDKSDEECIE
jgi:DNA-binding transcriptional ArsR family regulator